MELDVHIREKKLEEIRVFISKSFPLAKEETREGALNLVISSFYDRFYEQIQETNK